MSTDLHPFEDVFVVVVGAAEPGVGGGEGEGGEEGGGGGELHCAGCIMIKSEQHTYSAMWRIIFEQSSTLISLDRSFNMRYEAQHVFRS